MPAVRLIASKYHTLFIFFIAFNGEIISPCSYYIKKGLVYIIIANLSSRQSSFYSKCTKSNTWALYNMHSVFLNKCTSFTCFSSL